MDHEIFEAELKILREFIDFVNRQVGVYCDCLASFQGNHARVERQVAGLNIPMEKKYEKGQTVIVSASVRSNSTRCHYPSNNKGRRFFGNKFGTRF